MTGLTPIFYFEVSAIIILLVSLLVISWLRNYGLRKKYASIIDFDSECSKVKKNIDVLISERDKMNQEFLVKKEKLTLDYSNAHAIYDKLQKEIAVLEESVDMMEMGVYKPHFDFETSDIYRSNLEALREKEKDVIRSGDAAKCDVEWMVGGSKVEGRKLSQQAQKLMLRAFNGECDASLAKIRWDNITKMEERIKKAFEQINKSGVVNKVYLTNQYLELKLQELRLAFEYQEKIKEEKDEQKQIQEEMREEEKARREIEKAKEEAEAEEKRYQRALTKAREEMLKAKEGEMGALKDEIASLESKLKTAQEMKERAISQAQLTKSGHVYIISNIGSFGENVFKIGMTRRLDPLDRIKELSDASVPFSFDIHGMIYSENVPELERKFHGKFDDKRVNMSNYRKEFFNVSYDEIAQWTEAEKLDFKLTKLAEAREYRETLAKRQKIQGIMDVPKKQDLPISVENLFSKHD